MISFKTVLLTSLLGLAMADSDAAQINLCLTGSTVFRSQIHDSVRNSLTGETIAYDQATLNTSIYSIFTGSYGSDTLTVKCAWTGSTKGIKATAGSISVGFLPDTTSPAASGAGTPNVSIASLISAVPDICVADSDQLSTLYTGTYPYAQLVGAKLGVQPFVWIANEGSSANLTNMTPKLAKNLYVNGTLPLALWTGLSSDHTNIVYAFGGDPGSGARNAAFAESEIGVFATVVQWFPSPNITNATPTAVIPTPEDLVSDITSIEGNGGYNSGDKLAALFGNTFNIDGNSAHCGVTYVNVSDAAAAVDTGARILKWNGETLQVSPTADMTPVKEGKYTFWAYIHLYRRSDLSGFKLSFYNGWANGFSNAATIPLTDMHVIRSIDAGPISPLY